ncbi:MAG: hypothetical protein ABIH82_03555 [Candidatus Woesearchaeota archaeon]
MVKTFITLISSFILGSCYSPINQCIDSDPENRESQPGIIFNTSTSTLLSDECSEGVLTQYKCNDDGTITNYKTICDCISDTTCKEGDYYVSVDTSEGINLH